MFCIIQYNYRMLRKSFSPFIWGLLTLYGFSFYFLSCYIKLELCALILQLQATKPLLETTPCLRIVKLVQDPRSIWSSWTNSSRTQNTSHSQRTEDLRQKIQGFCDIGNQVSKTDITLRKYEVQAFNITQKKLQNTS